jgi:hypothetical protein
MYFFHIGIDFWLNDIYQVLRT